MEVGLALKRIRDSGTYKSVDRYENFAEFCRMEFSLERTRAFRYIGGADVVELLLVADSQNPPVNLSIAEVLVPLKDDPDILDAAWSEVAEAAPNGFP